MPNALVSLISTHPAADAGAALALPVVRPPAPIVHADIEGAALVRAEKAAGPPPKHAAIANQRWGFVRAVEDLLAAREARSEGHAVDLVRLTRQAEFPDIPLNVHNLRRWREALRDDCGAIDWSRREALVPRWATGRRERDGDARFWPIFAGFFEALERFSLPTAYEYACMACRRSGIERLPRLHQVRHWYEHADVRMRAECARRGPEWARNRVVGHITRSWDAVAPNDVWIGDHHQFDCMVKVPDGQGGWRAVRPWISAWLDGRSLAIVGWVVTVESPNHRTILEALRNGIFLNRLHCAAGLMTDQGSDYRLAGFTTPWECKDAPECHLQAIDDLGCTARASNAYNARAKTVERIFGVVCGMFAKLWPSYRGRNPVERPDKANYYGTHPEELPTQGQFSQVWEEWLAKVYHQRRGKGRILRGHSPSEVWTPGTGGPLLDTQSLRLGLAVPVAAPMVRAGGTVVYRGADWQSRELWPYVGSRVVLRIDAVNGAAFACDLRGRMLGELQIKRMVAALTGGADLEAAMREQATQRRALNLAIAEATAGTYGLGAVDRLQIDWSQAVALEKRGQVRSVTGPAHIYRHLSAVQDGESTSLASAVSVETPAPRAPAALCPAPDAAILERLLGTRADTPVQPAAHPRPEVADFALLADLTREGV
jgi:hypothetical protein